MIISLLTSKSIKINNNTQLYTKSPYTTSQGRNRRSEVDAWRIQFFLAFELQYKSETADSQVYTGEVVVTYNAPTIQNGNY